MLIFIRVSLLTKPTATDGLDAGWSLLCCKMMTRPPGDLELLARRGDTRCRHWTHTPISQVRTI